MTREEAVRECERLAQESPERATHSWMPREDATGVWSVARVNLPPADAGQRVPETRAAARPPSEAPPQSKSPAQYPGA